MASASISEQEAPDRTSKFAAVLTARPLVIALVMLAVVVAIRAFGTVDADVAWQLWIGRQLNHGAQLYGDIIETNPPLWFWMAMPVDRLSDLIHLRSDHLLILLIGGAAALSLAAVDRLLGAMSSSRRTFLLIYASLVLVAMPWLEFGQREHIALIGALPYAALIAARREGRAVPLAVAVAISVGAGLGFALKHYFLIVPVLLELWLLASLGRKWRPLRAETFAIAAVGALYAAALPMLAHDYLSNVVPMLMLAYGATGAKHFIDLFQPAVLVTLMSLLLLANRRQQRSPVIAAFTISAIGFAIAYFVQAKGWSYHALPMMGCAAVALGAALASGGNASRVTLLAAPALLVLPFTIAAQQALRQPEFENDVEQAVQGMHSGDSVGFIAADPSFGWHVIPQRGLRFALRYNGFWMMQAIVDNELRGGPNSPLTQLGRQVARETAQDFECTRPKRIVVKRPVPGSKGEFDIFTFFMRDPEFTSVMAHYRPVQRTSVEVFELVTPYARAGNCPTWSPV